jgi:hypothetical protein
VNRFKSQAPATAFIRGTARAVPIFVIFSNDALSLSRKIFPESIGHGHPLILSFGSLKTVPLLIVQKMDLYQTTGLSTGPIKIYSFSNKVYLTQHIAEQQIIVYSISYLQLWRNFILDRRNEKE